MKKISAVSVVLVVCFLVCGCGGGGGGSDHPDGLPGAKEDSQGNFHPSGFAADPQHGQDYSENPQYCRACHGDNLRAGASGISCLACHHGFAEMYCTGCHGATDVSSHGTHTQGTPKGPDALGCADCHVGTDKALIPDACDNCHSPGGAFDGVEMALANWDDIYESDGVTLTAGNERWCATCHDDGVAFSYPIIVDDVFVDNAGDANFGVTCDWGTGTGFQSQSYGDNVRYRVVGGTGGCAATWTPDLPMSGEYNVYARWTEYTNRAHLAPYTINYDGGTATQTVSVDQRDNGGQWILLGKFNFAADGTESIVLSADDAIGDAGDIVIADAVRFENVEYLGAYAPNVVGDNTTYGYYVNGHKLICTVCHDASGEHIDHNQRTYEVDESTCDPGPCVVVNSYEYGYRLSDVLSDRPMVIPKDSVDNPNALDPSEFALCFKCHDSGPILATAPGDPAVTNFYREDDPLNRNFHQYHLAMEALIWDSDWDAVVGGTLGASLDSMPNCPTCHNVHGSPSATMTRHGELISTPGTTDKVPALDFCYLSAFATLDCTITSAYPNSVGGSMVTVGYPENDGTPNGVCIHCHSGRIYYHRPPTEIPPPAAPTVSNVRAAPASVAADGSSSVLFSAYVIDPDQDLSSVEIDLSSLGGSADQEMYDDGMDGDAVAGDAVYSHRFPGTTAAAGNYTLTVTGIDDVGNTGTGEARIIVHDDFDAVIVDNLDAEFTCDWTVSTGNPGPGEFWGFNTQYRAVVDRGCTATWIPDVPGEGNYDVYARWTSYSNRGTSVPYTINYDGGADTVLVNQQQDGGAWVFLGSYPFAADASGSVVLSDDVTGGNVIIADAIKLEPVP